MLDIAATHSHSEYSTATRYVCQYLLIWCIDSLREPCQDSQKDSTRDLKEPLKSGREYFFPFNEVNDAVEASLIRYFGRD